MRRPRRWRPLACGAALAALACAEQLLAELGVPVAEGYARITDVAPRGGYLEAGLAGPNATLRFLFPASRDCRTVLQAAGGVDWHRVGAIGEVSRGATSCEAVGIASLPEWRDRRGPDLTSALPHGEEARFAVVYADPAVILVRGGFPQAVHVGWRRTGDSVAVLPHTAECRAAADAGHAPMAHHPEGPVALSLTTAAGACPILGLARPL
jgi:hypothetical protein